MSRLPRKNIESAFCHIIVQGINREYIFQKDECKQAYKNIFKKNLKETNIKVLAYCIMDNHIHILVYVKEISELIKVMRRTNTSYAKLYNKMKNRVGYVFRDRYYTQMILTEKQLKNCIVYIHNNPIKANIVNKQEKYMYSSYREYIGKKDLITTDSIKLVFGSLENYNKIFERIHNELQIEDIMDIKEEYVKSNKIISEFTYKNNKTIEDVINNEDEFCELLLRLRHDGGLSLRKMSDIFKINKDRLNRMINKKL